jgi:hypothetical protein
VTGHAERRGVTVDEALADCVDLELLAAEAVRRGLLARTDHQEALRAALVDRFVAEEFEARFHTSADLPAAAVDRYVKLRAADLERPEIRTMVYFRAPVPRTAAPGSPEDLAAKAFATEVHAAIGGRDDLYHWELKATAERLANGRKFEFAAPRAGGLQEDFGRAAYAVPDIGQVSPPTRTPWGWDVILIVDIRRAVKRTPEELLAADPLAVVRWYFDDWARTITAAFTVEKFPDRLAEPDDRTAAAGGPGGR